MFANIFSENIAAPSKALFKYIAIGYSIGTAIIFLPIFILGSFSIFLDQANGGLSVALGMLSLIPVILVVQGICFSGMVMLGL